MLDVLVYTDATDAESLSGRSGFQFVAHSAGATATDEAVARDRMQHAVPLALDAESWQTHPETCAFAAVDGRLYLSRGRSTGATLGGRPGNQLTVTIMTSDPYDVLPLRPAQLYSSPIWSFARPREQVLEPWLTPLEIADDFDVAGLHELLTEPWAAHALPAILTMLEQTQAEPRVRLIIRGSDQRLIMRWVALLSRFLDAEAALGLEFRVYAENALGTPAHIVGAHPRLSPDVTVDRAASLGVNVLDVDGHACSAVEPSEGAVRQARWFTTADPYDAFDAIEVARRWSRRMAPEVAARAAELAAMPSTSGPVTGDELRASLTALRELAGQGCADELEAYGDALADVVATCAPTGAEDLLDIDQALWAVVRVNDTGLGQTLALTALEWAAARPAWASAWAQAVAARGVAAPLRWDDGEARAHGAALLRQIVGHAPDATLSEHFALARALDAGLSQQDVARDIERLAALWVANPGLSDAANGWLHRDAVIGTLVGTLVAALERGDPAAIRGLQSGAWDWFATTPGVVDPYQPVTVWLASRWLPTATRERRAELLAQVQRSLPSWAWSLFLSTPAGLRPDEVAGWVAAHGVVDATLGAELERVLTDVHRLPAPWAVRGAEVLQLLDGLAGGGSVPPRLARLAAAQRQILALFDRAHAGRATVPNHALETLVQTYGSLLPGLSAHHVVRALLESADVRVAKALLRGDPSGAEVDAALGRAIRDGLRGASEDTLAAVLRLMAPSGDATDDETCRSVVKRHVDAFWDDRSTEVVRTRLVESFRAHADPVSRLWLDEYLSNQGKGRLGRQLRTTYHRLRG